MASLYKNNNTWYLSVTHNGIRKTRSLKTKSYKVAKTIKSHAESTLIAEINGFVTKNENLSFDELSKRFLAFNHGWSINTYKLIKHILTSHLSLVNHCLPTQHRKRFIFDILTSAGNGVLRII